MTRTSSRACPWALPVLCLLASAASGQNMLFRIDGERPDDWLGMSVAYAGDVDGDGHGDVVVGVPFEDTAGVDAGAARIHSGLGGATLRVIPGALAGDGFGNAVGGAGDCDADGFADVVIGARFADVNGTDSGSVTVISGRDGSVLLLRHGGAAGELLGTAVGAAGDVDADGFDDVIVGAPGAALHGPCTGSALVISGRDGTVLHTFDGLSAGDLLGSSVAGAGDVDGDGFADLIVGAWRDDDQGFDSGSARVFSGFDGGLLHTFVGDRAFDRLGFCVAGAGDIDRDGFDDLIVGVPGADDNGSGCGAAIVYSGATGAALRTVFGDSAGDMLGYSVAGAGDVDGDGHADVIAGAPGDDDNGSGAGAARTFSGFDGTILGTLRGNAAYDGFGVAVASAGDADADGFFDVVVGSYWDDHGSPDSGSAYAYSLAFTGTPPRARTLGAGCPGSGGRVPRIGLRGRLEIGTVSYATLRGAVADSAGAALQLGDAIPPVPLDLVGAPGCWLYQSAFATVPVGTGAHGMAELALELPYAPPMIGLTWDLQWLVPDPGSARALPITTSDALRIWLGD